MKSVVKKNAFTIVELLVAMSLLVILLGLSGMVFNTTVAAHRAAGASIDVSRNLRAITEQLSNDFRGLRKDAPLTIWFEQDADGRRYDQIQFFADGDFQSTKQYAGQTIYGNVARVYYGHGWLVDFVNVVTDKGYREFSTANGDAVDLEPSSILTRRLHISTNEPALNTLLTQFPIDTVTNQYHATNFGPLFNNHVEYDNFTSLNLWKQLLTIPANCNIYLATCFNNTMPPGNSTVAGRPVVDMGDVNYLHNLLAQGVLEMQVQWAYTVEDLTQSPVSYVPIPLAIYFTGIRWWPSIDPDGNGNVADSDFGSAAMKNNQFGAYFEMPIKAADANWNRVKLRSNEITLFPGEIAQQRCRTQLGFFRQDFYPKALKFTFVLRDSNGIFTDGKTFTHIVYIDN